MKRTNASLRSRTSQLCDLATSRTSPKTRVYIGSLLFTTILCLGALWLPAQTLTTLHSFSAASADGATPFGGVIIDGKGNLYGTTAFGGSFSRGTVFKLDSSGNESTLYSFEGGTDGANPVAGLTLDSTGNLYGTTNSGGASNNCSGGCGTVFKLDSGGNETLLYNFTGNITGDGRGPGGNLVLDSSREYLRYDGAWRDELPVLWDSVQA